MNASSMTHDAVAVLCNPGSPCHAADGAAVFGETDVEHLGAIGSGIYAAEKFYTTTDLSHNVMQQYLPKPELWQLRARSVPPDKRVRSASHDQPFVWRSAAFRPPG